MLDYFGYFVIVIMVLLADYSMSTSTSGAYAMVGIFLSLFIFINMGNDPLHGWDKIVMTLPVTRRQVVGAKYVINLLMIVAAFLISIIIGELMSKESVFIVYFGNVFADRAVACLMIGFALIENAILLPICLKFGIKTPKDRKTSLSIGISISTILLTVIPFLFFIVYELWFEALLMPLLESHYLIVGTVYFLFAVFCNMISYFISVRIYEQKEF